MTTTNYMKQMSGSWRLAPAGFAVACDHVPAEQAADYRGRAGVTAFGSHIHEIELRGGGTPPTFGS